MRTVAAVCSLALIIASPAVAEQEAPPSPRAVARPFKLQADVSGRLNPFGLVLQISGNYRRELGRVAAGRPAPYLSAGLGLGVTPASATTSAHVEWMQRPFLVLRVRGDLCRYFGTNGVLLELPDKDSPFGSEAVKALSGRELARFAGRVLIQPTLRAKLGPLMVQNQTDLAWFHLGKGGPYFWDRGYDTLLKDGDGLVLNRTVIMAPLWSTSGDTRLLAGPGYEFQRSFASGLKRQRLGAAVQLSAASRLGPFARPRIAVQSGVYLQDRNRKGQLFTVFQLGADLKIW